MYLKKIMAATFAATALAGQAQEKTFSIIPEPVDNCNRTGRVFDST